MVTPIIIITFALGSGVWSLPYEKQTNVAIYGGHEVPIESAPYMASLRLNSTYHWCGAAIIHERFVLSAAHCILPARKYQYKVVVGTENLEKNGELYRVDQIIKHENYNKTTSDFDVCLIKLAKPLTFGPKVAIIPLLSPKTKITKKDVLNITGWGATEKEEVSKNLLQTNVPMVPKRLCQRMYLLAHQIITKRMMCAGSEGHDSCQGDSGGPLTLGNELVGITSFGYGCGKLPGVYTRVAAVKTWIEETVGLYKI